MTIENFNTKDRDHSAKMNRTFRVQLTGDHSSLYPVHIPVVDLPQSIIDTMPPEERHRAYDVHLMFSAVTLCLN